MNIHFPRFLSIVLCFVTAQTIAQTSSMKINVSIDSDQYNDFKLIVMKDGENIGEYFFDEYYLPVEIDSLESGIYKLQLFEYEKPNGLMLQKTVTLIEDLQTSVDLTLYYEEDTYEPVANDYTQKSEAQFSLGYFDGNWTDESAIRSNFSASMDFSSWFAFSKHIGVLAGSGFNISQHYFRKDTSLFENIPFKKVFERYASINMNYELKFRFSTGNQQSEDFNSSKFFVDLGARYNLPLLFNHAAMYRGSKKVVERNIHDFTDFRAFVNIGFAPVSFFMEYRLSDFIRDDNPQLPKFNAGFKFTFDN